MAAVLVTAHRKNKLRSPPVGPKYRCPVLSKVEMSASPRDSVTVRLLQRIPLRAAGSG